MAIIFAFTEKNTRWKGASVQGEMVGYCGVNSKTTAAPTNGGVCNLGGGGGVDQLLLSVVVWTLDLF